MTTTFAVPVTGDLLSAFERQLGALRPVPVTMHAILERSAAEPRLPLLNAVVIQRAAMMKDEPAEALALVTCIERADEHHARRVSVEGLLAVADGGVVLRDGEGDALAVWVEAERQTWSGLAGRRVVATGLFERRKAGREPGYGPEGQYRYRLAAIAIKPAAAPKISQPPVSAPPVREPRPKPRGETRTEPRSEAASSTGYRRDGFLYVAIRDVAAWLGLALVWDKAEGLLVIEDRRGETPRRVATLRPGRRVCTVSGEQALCLPVPPELRGNRIHIPLEFAEAAFRVRVVFGGEGKVELRVDDQVLRIEAP